MEPKKLLDLANLDHAHLDLVLVFCDDGWYRAFFSNWHPELVGAGLVAGEAVDGLMGKLEQAEHYLGEALYANQEPKGAK